MGGKTTGRGKLKFSEIRLPQSLVLFTTNVTWTTLGLHVGLHGKMCETKRMRRRTPPPTLL